MKKIIQVIAWVFFVVFFTSCKESYSPKPRGYYRVDLPEKSYKLYDSLCPYKFEIPDYANVVSDNLRSHTPCWINVWFPRFNATLHISYMTLKDNELGILLEDTYKLAYKHSQKADGINNILINLPDHNVYGMFYDIKGNVASAKQFYITDSLNHYLRGALYFNEVPNKDSLAPVLQFISKDLDHLINTFEWKN